MKYPPLVPCQTLGHNEAQTKYFRDKQITPKLCLGNCSLWSISSSHILRKVTKKQSGWYSEYCIMLLIFFKKLRQIHALMQHLILKECRNKAQDFLNWHSSSTNVHHLDFHFCTIQDLVKIRVCVLQPRASSPYKG